MTEQEYIEEQAQRVFKAKKDINGEESVEILRRKNGEIYTYFYTFTNDKMSQTVELQPQSKARYEELIK